MLIVFALNPLIQMFALILMRLHGEIGPELVGHKAEKLIFQKIKTVILFSSFLLILFHVSLYFFSLFFLLRVLFDLCNNYTFVYF